MRKSSANAIRSLWPLLVAAALVLGVALVVAEPAWAHENLVSSSPSEGEVFEDAPAVVELEFTADVLTIGAGVIVMDAAGTDWADGEPAIDGSEVSVALKPGIPDGGYQVRWRVISGDGHPISSIIPFTVGDGEPFLGTPQATPVESAPVESAPAVEATPDTDSNPGELAPWARILLLALGGALVALLLYVGARLATSHLASRRQAKQPPHAPEKSESEK